MVLGGDVRAASAQCIDADDDNVGRSVQFGGRGKQHGGSHNRWLEAARKHSRAMRHNTRDCSQRSDSSRPLNVRA